MELESMNYIDKNGSQWSIDKGDWIGSFDKGDNLRKKFIIRFSIPLLFVVIISLILFG